MSCTGSWVSKQLQTTLAAAAELASTRRKQHSEKNIASRSRCVAKTRSLPNRLEIVSASIDDDVDMRDKKMKRIRNKQCRSTHLSREPSTYESSTRRAIFSIVGNHRWRAGGWWMQTLAGHESHHRVSSFQGEIRNCRRVASSPSQAEVSIFEGLRPFHNEVSVGNAVISEE